MLQGESSGTAGLPTSPSEIPPLHDNLQHTNLHSPEEMLQGESSGTSSTTLGAPRLQNDLQPPGTPPVHSGGPGEDVDLWRWYYDSRVYQPPSSSSEYHSEVALPLYAPPPAPAEPEVPQPEVPEPEVNTFFNDARKQKLKTIAKVGGVAGASVIFTLAIQKVINDFKNRTYVSAFFPPSLADI
jgi:hypothetical protein